MGQLQNQCSWRCFIAKRKNARVWGDQRLFLPSCLMIQKGLVIAPSVVTQKGNYWNICRAMEYWCHSNTLIKLSDLKFTIFFKWKNILEKLNSKVVCPIDQSTLTNSISADLLVKKINRTSGLQLARFLTMLLSAGAGQWYVSLIPQGNPVTLAHFLGVFKETSWSCYDATGKPARGENEIKIRGVLSVYTFGKMSVNASVLYKNCQWYNSENSLRLVIDLFTKTMWDTIIKISPGQFYVKRIIYACWGCTLCIVLTSIFGIGLLNWCPIWVGHRFNCHVTYMSVIHVCDVARHDIPWAAVAIYCWVWLSTSS